MVLIEVVFETFEEGKLFIWTLATVASRLSTHPDKICIIFLKKQGSVATKLAEECRKYGMEGPGVGSPLARAAMQYGATRSQVERERDNTNRIFGTQVADPLQAMVTGAPLEDARQLIDS